MSSSLSFQSYAKLVTTKLRARMHNQSFANTVMERERTATTPAGRITRKCVDELVRIKLEHQSTFNPALRARALKLMQTLPLMSINEDPHFIQSIRSLRVAAYFRAAQLPSTFALLNHITKHTYMLDGYNLFQLAATLLELEHAQTGEVLEVLRPRIRQAALNWDITAAEVTLLLRVLHKYDIEDSDLIDKLANIIQHTIRDLSVVDVTRCVSVLPYTRNQALGREILLAAEGKLCELMEEAVASYRVYCDGLSDNFQSLCMTFFTERNGLTGSTSKAKEVEEILLNNIQRNCTLIRQLSHAVTWTGWAPRRVISALIRAALANSGGKNTPEDVKSSTSRSDSQALVSGETAEVQRPTARTLPASLEESAEKTQGLRHTTPSLSRHDICLLMKALCAVYYRDERALLILCNRVATFGSSQVEHTTEQGPDILNELAPPRTLPHASPLSTIQDLSLAIECLAYFYLSNARSVVAELLHEVSGVVCHSTTPLIGTPAVEALSRILLSLARLQYPLAAVGATASIDRAILVGISTCEAVTRYCMSPYCGVDVLLASHLLSGLVRVGIQLDEASGANLVDSQLKSKWSLCVSSLLKALTPALLSSAVNPVASSPTPMRRPPTHLMNDIAASIDLIRSHPSTFDFSILQPTLQHLQKVSNF